MTRHTPESHDDHSTPDAPGSLDALLREWHDENAERARAQRDQLLASVSATLAAKRTRNNEEHVTTFSWADMRKKIMTRYMPIAASLALVVTLIAILVPMSAQPAFADGGVIMVPEGGKLEALDEKGNLIGPCALKHTHVDVDVSGFLARVTLTQEYNNPYDQKIEAVYTFPMSHRGAVDGFKMIVGDRVVEGEVKEREAARQMYEQARDAGYVASLLEQERPNIFTQSVANIEPEATVKIEISYIELIEEKDGEYEFAFPMVVGPRYIPGRPTVTHAQVPAELTLRRGVILLGPAQLTIGAGGDTSKLGTLQPGKLEALIESAQAIEYPGDVWWGKGNDVGGAQQPTLWHRFEAAYCDGSKEFGELFTDGTAWINGRWFYFDPGILKDMGTGFSQNTNQVPDASKVTPMPVKPGTRAGHDISLTMKIDTGGPGITAIDSALHEINGGDIENKLGEPPSKLTIELANAKEIPNRDFVLAWKQESDKITEATFTHTGQYGDYTGGFFTLILQPPDRVGSTALRAVSNGDAESSGSESRATTEPVRPRELVFVMDTSGSMSGFPVEKSKEVVSKAIASMRPDDTFNIITFAGDTSILWPEPRPATEANRAAAQAFVSSRQGGGGTEMMKAINAALVQQEAPALRADQHHAKALSLEELANLPADGREVEVEINFAQWGNLKQGESADIAAREDLKVTVRREWTEVEGFIGCPVGESQIARGSWSTVNGQRVFIGKSARWMNAMPMPAPGMLDPMRIVLFLTDGYVGNEAEIIQAVRDNAKTTRVFSFGIGDSINRFLLDSMAEAGRGEVEYVLLNTDGKEAVERFTKRIETPVLTDISLTFSDGLEVTDILPKGGMVPDLFDAKPLVIQGRYAPGRENAKGTLTIRGNTGGGAYERTLDIEFPANQPEHKATATLWARSMVDEFTKQVERDPNAVASIIKLGETFQMMTAHTSFVAVEKSRVTIEGKPVLVAIPIELPQGTRWEGFFGGEADADDLQREDEIMLGAQLRLSNVRGQQVMRTELDNIDGFGVSAGDDLAQLNVATRFRLTDQLAVNERIAGKEGARVQLGYVSTTPGDPNASTLYFVAPPADGILDPAESRQLTGAWHAGEELQAGQAIAGVPATATGSVNAPAGGMARRETRGRDADPSIAPMGSRRSVQAGPGLAGRQLAPPPAPQAPSATAARPGAPGKAGTDSFANAPGANLEQALHEGERGAAASGGAGGGGGFGGGGGGSGGGGTIFDDPDDGEGRTVEEDYRENAKTVVMEMMYSDLWDEYGGDTLRFEWVNDQPVVVPLKRDGGALSAAIIAQAFVDHYLPVLRPDLELEFDGFRGGTDFVDSPENISLLKKLSEKRISVSMKDATLESILQAISALGEVPIAVEWEALNTEFVKSPTSVVSLEVTDVPVGEALSQLLANLALHEWERPSAGVIGGAVIISTMERIASRTVIHAYDVTDLVSVNSDEESWTSEEILQNLIDTLSTLIEPDMWAINGGNHINVHAVDGVMFVGASLDLHRRVQATLTSLREALGPQVSSQVWRMPDSAVALDRPTYVINRSTMQPSDVQPLNDDERQFVSEWFASAEDAIADQPSTGEVAQFFIDVMTRRIKPDSWDINGGDEAQVRSFRDLFVVQAPQDTLTKVSELFGVDKVQDITVAINTPDASVKTWPERAVERMDRLARVLDPTLLPLAVAPEAPTDQGAEKPGAEDPAGVRMSVGAGLRLTVLIDSIDPPVIKAIESMGATVEGTSSAGPLLVASVPQAVLWKLAMMDEVRRIEPLRAKPAN